MSLTDRAALARSATFGHAAAVLPRPYTILVCALLLAVSVGAALAAAHAGEARATVYRRAKALTELGRQLFFDPRLSASGKQACASCHDPDYDLGPPNSAPVQPGGADMRQAGVRAVPSLKYLQATPQFAEHYFESEDAGYESVDNGPTGGLTWDGRADRGRDQARLPLLSPVEMANKNAAEVAMRARQIGYDKALRRIYGPAVIGSDEAIFTGVLNALEAFEQDPATFYPYNSKYDAYLAGKTELTAQETRGLALFEDPAKGNCAQCHISQRGNDGTPPQFTDYGLIAIGVPRNAAIPANSDQAYYDLGVCGPFRTDLATRPEYCGLFKTPTLRNVAKRQVFFHNGIYRSLRQVMEFYVQRDTDPEKWYSRNADGRVNKFDDLPARYRDNINTDPPFDREPGDKPALDAAEIDDIIAFLQTLTDGYAGGR